MVAKHAKQEPLNMLTLGDSAVAMMVKGCAEPFAVLSNGNDPRTGSQATGFIHEPSRIGHETVQRESPNHDVPQAFLQCRSHDQ